MKQKKPAPRAAKKATPKRSGKSVTLAKSSGRFNKFHLLALVLVFAIIGLAYTFVSRAATGDGSIGVYRLFQPGSQEHMFTTSAAEKDNLAKAGFSNEGFSLYAWPDANNGRKPVYRLYPKGAGGKHLFTISEVEKNALVAGGWTLESKAFYAYDTPGAGRIPAYRMSGKNLDKIYTTSAFERDQLVASKNYNYEGIAFYVSDGASAPAQNTHGVSGGIDPSSCGTLAGWALDGDNIGAAVRVDAYVQGIGIATAPTNVARADINRIFSTTGNHGYNITIPDRWKDGQPHWADVYGINIDSKGKVNGDNAKIGHREFACDKAGKDHMPEILAQRAAEAERQRKIAEAQAAAAAAAQKVAEAQAAADAHAAAIKESDAQAYATIFAYFHGGAAKQNRSLPPQPADNGAAAFFAAVNAAKAQQAAALAALAKAGAQVQQPNPGAFASAGLGLSLSNFAKDAATQYSLANFANSAINSRTDNDIANCEVHYRVTNFGPSGYWKYYVYVEPSSNISRVACLQKAVAIKMGNPHFIEIESIWFGNSSVYNAGT